MKCHKKQEALPCLHRWGLHVEALPFMPLEEHLSGLCADVCAQTALRASHPAPGRLAVSLVPKTPHGPSHTGSRRAEP